jgi:acetyl-CoA carboxylase beta subunit
LVQTTIRRVDTSGEKKVRTEGLWVKCDGCRQIIWKKDLEENLNVCPKCDKHFRIDARTRLAQLLDDNQYEVFDSNLVSTDPLEVRGSEGVLLAPEAGEVRYRPERRHHQCPGKLNGRP